MSDELPFRSNKIDWVSNDLISFLVNVSSLFRALFVLTVLFGSQNWIKFANKIKVWFG